jgi:hypothetical protein
MQNAMSNVVILYEKEDLSFVNVSCICPTMNDSVSVMGKGGSDI